MLISNINAKKNLSYKKNPSKNNQKEKPLQTLYSLVKKKSHRKATPQQLKTFIQAINNTKSRDKTQKIISSKYLLLKTLK